MKSFVALARLAAIVGCLAVAAPAFAQQGGPVNPTAQSVKEEQLLNALKPGGTLTGRVTIPDEKAGVVMQPAGRNYQSYQTGALKTLGAVAILGMLILLAAFYFMRGKIAIDGGAAGRTVTRFNGFERFVHWLTAGCFLVLAVSGLNLIFGRSILLPILGEGAFGWLSMWLKVAHNYLAFPFMLGLGLMFLIWVAHNVPNAGDIAWLKAGGGLVGKEHPPAKKFNGGQKVIFWLVIVSGVILSVSGWNLLFGPGTMPIAEITWWQWLHGMVGVLIVAVMLAHIYIGSMGMEGAFDAMGSGEVDLNWAKQHHSLWAAEVAQGGAPADAKIVPAE